jgi:hypothetical protein
VITSFSLVRLAIALTLGTGLGLGSGVAAAQITAISPRDTAAPAVGPEVNTEAVAQTHESGLVLPFTDVPQDHWAYQALLNLAGVYGCVSGYPDGTFRGENTVTRHEFAAGMDSCMGVLNQLLQLRQQEQQQILDTLMQDLQQSFQELRDIEESL